MFRVTIGIRAYNIEPYIEQCLNSVYNQTIKNDIQIVIIEDCSTDNTLNIINTWVDTHKDVSTQVYQNSINQGAGVGLILLQQHIQNTEYVIILDGDDFYLKSDCLEYMYNFIKKHEFDFVKFSKNINDYHVKNLVKYDIYKQINFNPFRYDEDGYTNQILRLTSNWVLHDYDFYYYRNNINSVCHNSSEVHPLLRIFADVYYRGIPEAVLQLQKLEKYENYMNVYEQLSTVKYTINPGVLVLTKGTDITEWVNHYINLGFKSVFILDNNTIPIQNIWGDVVTLIHYNAPFINFPEFQATAYDHALSIIKQTDINYLLIVDDDEYLQLNNYSSITEFIINEMLIHGFYNCHIKWETYDDNDIIYEEDCKQSIQETYTRIINSDKQSDILNINWSKPLFRIIPEVKFNKSSEPAHKPNDYLYNSIFQYYTIVNNSAVIKHYRTQCLETFLKNKVLQKKFLKGSFGKNGLLKCYFTINTCTIAKLIAFNELCNKYQIDYDLNEYNHYLTLIKQNRIT